MLPTGNSNWKKAMVTPQIMELASEFCAAVRLGERGVKSRGNSGGMILDGPFGMGKTTISRLLVSMAFVNQAIVVYIVRYCSVSCLIVDLSLQPHLDYYEIKGAPSAACYFLKRFLGFNAINASRIPVSIRSPLKATNLFELAAAGAHDESLAHYAYERLIAELKEHIEHPVVYAIDDFCDSSKNSSLKEYQTERPRHLHSDFRLVHSLEQLQGARTFILVSNTGYFATEERLSEMMRKWVRHVKPLSHDLFIKAICDNGPFQFPSSLTHDRKTVQELQFLTGSLPSGLAGIKRCLDRNETLDEWSATYRHESIYPAIQRFETQLKEASSSVTFRDLLDHLFYPPEDEEGVGQELLAVWQKFLKTDLVVHHEVLGYRPRDWVTEMVLLSEYFECEENPDRCETLREFSLRVQSYAWHRQSWQARHPNPTYLLSGWKESVGVPTILPGFHTRKVINLNKLIEKNTTAQACLYVMRVTDLRTPWRLVFHRPPAPKKDPDSSLLRNHSIYVPDEIDQSKHQLMFVSFVLHPPHGECCGETLWKRMVESFDLTAASGWAHSQENMMDTTHTLSFTPAMMSEVERIARGITGSECKASITPDGRMSVEGDDIADVQFVVVTNLVPGYLDVCTNKERVIKDLSLIKMRIIGPAEVPENANLRVMSTPSLSRSSN